MNITQCIIELKQKTTAFMYHSNNCEWQKIDGSECDCGYIQILNSVKIDFQEILDYTNNMQSSKT